MKRSRFAAAVLFAFALSSSTTLPRTARADDDPVTTQARARFKEGVDAFDKGLFENARIAFLQAYALKKHPAVLLNLAQSSAKAGHPLEASKSFQQFLKESTTASPQQRADAESGLADVRQKLGHIEVTAPAGTEITLDEMERLGTAPFAEPIDVEPGLHSLRASNETVRVTAIAGQNVSARFGGGLQPVVPVPVATSTPTTAPPAPVAETGPSAPQAAERSASHSSFASRANMTPVVLGLVAGGLGLAGTIIFAAFKIDAQSNADSVAAEIRSAATKRNLETTGICNSANSTLPPSFWTACSTLRDNNSRVDTNATIANVSAVVMVVGLLTATGWYLFAPKRETSTATAKLAPKPSGPPVPTPYAGYGSAGFTLSGTF